MNLPACEMLAIDRPAPHVLRITMSRPEAANAQNTRMGEELAALFGELYLDAGDVRCIVFTGAGDRVFSAGGDLKERNGMTTPQWQRQHAVFEQVLARLLDCPVPVIAAVNGAAYGGGCELALACDFIHAASHARFALTEVSLGIVPGTGGTQTLARACGPRRAKELVLTAAPFSAQQAHEWGMVNSVVDGAQLQESVLETATRIARNAPLAVRRAKRAIDVGAQLDLRSGLAYELEAYNRLVETQDRLEGVRAFNEKRAPLFKGE